MRKKRQNHTAAFKAKVALEAIKENLTVAQISSKYKIDATLVGRWKKELLERSSEVFSKGKDPGIADKEKEINNLYRQVGKLTVQNEFLREKLFP